jgi:hypothetical protein
MSGNHCGSGIDEDPHLCVPPLRETLAAYRLCKGFVKSNRELGNEVSGDEMGSRPIALTPVGYASYRRDI